MCTLNGRQVTGWADGFTWSGYPLHGGNLRQFFAQFPTVRKHGGGEAAKRSLCIRAKKQSHIDRSSRLC